jgi:hypothetical protein
MMTKRKKSKAATTARTAKSKSAPKNKRPDGSISSGIYDAVEKMIAGGKMTRTAAFRQIAKQSGRKEGTVAVNYYYAAKKRGAKMRPKAKSAPKSAAKGVKAAKSGGSISAAIYDAIEKLIAGGGMTRAAAFRQHAKATGRKEGTVAVNYYYAAKKRSAGKRGPGRPKMAVSARNGAGSSRIESVLKSLADLIRAQEAELSALRREGARFAELRRLLG